MPACNGNTFLVQVLSFQLQAQETLFRVQNFDKDELLHVLNYMLIFIKWYMYMYICKTIKIDIYFKNCLLKLKCYLKVEKYISYANGKQLDFDEKWSTVINSLQF